MKFLLITLAAILGNGLGAWNIRTVSSGRAILTAILTFSCVIIQQLALREVYTAITGKYILAWAVGSTIGITGSIFVDKKFQLWRDKCDLENKKDKTATYAQAQKT